MTPTSPHTHTQVLSAKVMAKAQSKNERFGYVSMGTAEEARKSIAGLNGTEVKGRSVTVEVVSLYLSSNKKKILILLIKNI